MGIFLETSEAPSIHRSKSNPKAFHEMFSRGNPRELLVLLYNEGHKRGFTSTNVNRQPNRQNSTLLHHCIYSLNTRVVVEVLELFKLWIQSIYVA